MAGDDSQMRKRKGDKKSTADADKAASDSTPPAPTQPPHVVAPSQASRFQPQFLLYAVLITLTGLYFHWLAAVYNGFEVPNSTPRQSTFANPLTSLLPASVPCPANAVCDDQWTITKCASDWFDIGLTSVQKVLSWPPGSPPGQSTVLLPPPLDHPQCFFNTTKYTHLKLDHYGDEHLAALGRDSENYMRKMAGIVECHATDPNVDEGISKGTKVVRWFEADLAKRVPRAYGFPVSFVRLAAETALVRRRKAASKPPPINGMTPPKPHQPVPSVEEFNERMANLLAALPSFTPPKGNLAATMLANTGHSLFLQKHTAADGTVDEEKSYLISLAPPVVPAKCGTWKVATKWIVPLAILFGWSFALIFAVLEARRLGGRNAVRPPVAPASVPPQ